MPEPETQNQNAQPAPFPSDTAFLVELFLLFGGAYFLVTILSAFPVFRPFDWIACLVALQSPVLLLFGWFLTQTQRARLLLFPSLWRRGGAFAAFVVFPVLVAGLWGTVALFFLNGAMDSELKSARTSVFVVEAQRGDAKGGENCEIRVEIPPGEPEPLTGFSGNQDRFPIVCRSFHYIHKGNLGWFDMRPGALGIRWIERYEIQLDVGATESPLGAFDSFWKRRLGLDWVN